MKNKQKENNLETSGGIFDRYQMTDTAPDNSSKTADALQQIANDAVSSIDNSPASDSSPIAENSPVTNDSPAEKKKDSPAGETAASPASDDNIKKEAPAPSKPPKKQKAKKTGAKIGTVAAILGAVLIAAGALAVVIFLNCFVIVGDLFGSHEILPAGTEELDLSGRSYSDYSGLSRLDKLRSLNLTGSSFDDLPALYGCDSLETVTWNGKAIKAEDCLEFYSHLPNAALQCLIDINGREYDSQITEITAVNENDATQKMYAAFKNLRLLDLTGCSVSANTYATLTESLPECTVKANLTINGREYATDAEQIEIVGALTNEDITLLRHFKNLKSIDLSQCTNPDEIKEITAQKADIRIIRAITVLDKTFSTSDELMDLRGSKYTLEQVKTALSEAIPQMTVLKKVDMCGCGLTNEEMEELCGLYPQIKFVWIIHLSFWDVRTDAVIFSSLNGVHFSSEKVYEPVFKYCTDLVALDLGHNVMHDISKISSLKKLRAAILMDNKLTDISALAELKDLEFLEININRIESVKPLEKLDKLMYVDFWSSKGLTDLSPLYNHDKLKIAIFHRSVPDAERVRFKKSNPNCDTFYEVDSLKVTTNIQWRSTPYRKRLKTAFTDWKYVVGFNEETGDFIYDYNTDQYAYM